MEKNTNLSTLSDSIALRCYEHSSSCLGTILKRKKKILAILKAIEDFHSLSVETKQWYIQAKLFRITWPRMQFTAFHLLLLESCRRGQITKWASITKSKQKLRTKWVGEWVGAVLWENGSWLEETDRLHPGGMELITEQHSGNYFGSKVKEKNISRIFNF